MVVYFGACDVVWGTLQALYPPLYSAPANTRFAAPHWVIVVWILTYSLCNPAIEDALTFEGHSEDKAPGSLLPHLVHILSM